MKKILLLFPFLLMIGCETVRITKQSVDAAGNPVSVEVKYSRVMTDISLEKLLVEKKYPDATGPDLKVEVRGLTEQDRSSQVVLSTNEVMSKALDRIPALP